MLSSNIQSSTETIDSTPVVRPRPHVSVVIPAYNCARLLSRAIATVQAQTFGGWELLVINDGSTDSTAVVATHRATTDERIHVFHQPKQGVSATRNWGITRARGELIAFLDPDDTWEPDKLATHVQQFQQQANLGVSFDQVALIDANGHLLEPVDTPAIVDLSAANLLYGTPRIRPSSWVVRRQVFTEVGGFLLGLSYAQDWEWLLRVACRDRWQIQGIPAVLTHCSQHSQLTEPMADPNQMQMAWQQLMERIRQYAPQLVQQHYKLAQAVHLQTLAEQSLQLQLPAAIAWDFMRRALQADWRLFTHSPGKTTGILAAIAQHGLFRR